MQQQNVHLIVKPKEPPQELAPEILTWDTLRVDRLTMEWLAFVGGEYDGLASRLVEDCRHFAMYSDVIYLIDLDTLRDHLEVGAAGSRQSTFASDFLLLSSTRRYGIPLGAFRELEDWL